MYTYANGNPVSYIDPTGTWAEASLTRQIGGYLDSALSWFGRTPFPSYYGQSSSLAQDVFQLPGVQIALLPAMITPVGLEEAAALGAVRGAEELITLTKARFGHTFTRHGQGATDFLFKRAAGSGKPMGQFLDDQAAARLIQDNIGSLKNGAISVPVPQGFPARIIMPDGSISAPSSVRIVPSGNGVKTAYPEL